MGAQANLWEHHGALRLHFERTTTSPEQTAALAAGLADVLRPGDVVALRGDLGAGKTTFVRALGAAMGVAPGMIASPTFVFVHVYPVAAQASSPVIPPAPPTIRRLIHIDAYRITSSDDLEPLGWDRLFGADGKALGDSVALIEWPERLGNALAREHAEVELAATGETARRLAFTLPEPWSDRPQAALLAQRDTVLCPATRRWVSPTSPTYPFSDERARQADLFGWLAEKYTLGRTIKPDDEDQ